VWLGTTRQHQGQQHAQLVELALTPLLGQRSASTVGLVPTPLLLGHPSASAVELEPTSLGWVQLYLQPVSIVGLALIPLLLEPQTQSLVWPVGLAFFPLQVGLLTQPLVCLV